MNELINKDNEWIIHFMGSLDRLLDNVEHLTASYRPTLNGERFFTDKEVSARLKVSRRTLQDYRNEGLSVGRRSGIRQPASFRCRIHGRGFYRPTESPLIFLKERSLPSAHACGSNGTTKRNGLRMKHQCSASSVSRSSISSDFRQSLVSVAGCPKCVWQAVARFSG